MDDISQKFKEVCQIMNSKFIDDLKENVKDAYLYGTTSDKKRLDIMSKLTKVDKMCKTLEFVP